MAGPVGALVGPPGALVGGWVWYGGSCVGGIAGVKRPPPGVFEVVV